MAAGIVVVGASWGGLEAVACECYRMVKEEISGFLAA